MKNKMLKELQEYYYSLKDVNGYWRKEPVGIIYNERTSKENLVIIKKVLTIIMDSDYISVETKVYISSKGISIKDVNEFINNARKLKVTASGNILKPLSYNNTCLKLQTDNRELESYLGNDILRSIVYNRTSDETYTNKRLVKFQERFGENYNYRDNLGIRIDPIAPKVNSYLNNEDFFDILGSLEAYLVQRRELVEQAVNSNKEFVEYFNYLLSKKAIDNEAVRVDRERLIRFLNNKDYVSGYTDTDQETTEEYKSFTEEEQFIREVRPEDLKPTNADDIDLENYTAYNYDVADKMV